MVKDTDQLKDFAAFLIKLENLPEDKIFLLNGRKISGPKMLFKSLNFDLSQSRFLNEGLL